MPMEEWKDIEGWEGYQVSSEGNVRSLDRVIEYKDGAKHFYKGKILKPIEEYNGYLRLYLIKNCKKEALYLHRLVANAFLPNPDNLPQVNHKNEVKTDNRADNLEWMSAKDNTNYGTCIQRRADKKSKPVYQYTLDNQLVKVWKSIMECRRNGFCGVSWCCRGKRNEYKGFRWSYTPLEAHNA